MEALKLTCEYRVLISTMPSINGNVQKANILSQDITMKATKSVLKKTNT